MKHNNCLLSNMQKHSKDNFAFNTHEVIEQSGLQLVVQSIVPGIVHVSFESSRKWNRFPEQNFGHNTHWTENYPTTASPRTIGSKKTTIAPNQEGSQNFKKKKHNKTKNSPNSSLENFCPEDGFCRQCCKHHSIW